MRNIFINNIYKIKYQLLKSINKIKYGSAEQNIFYNRVAIYSQSYQFSDLKHRYYSTNMKKESTKILIHNKYQKPYLSSRKSSDVQEFKSTPSEQPKNVGNVLEMCLEQLKKEEIFEAELHAEYIVSHALGINRSDLSTCKNQTLLPNELEMIRKMMECRLARMPLQYIMGDWEFHTIKLKLRPPVFIPRQETESLVNISVTQLKDIETPRVLDVGCGSGAISLALLNILPSLTCVALDQSKYAKDLTIENATDLNLMDRLEVLQGKVTDESFPSLPYENFDLIVSNPPYVLRKDLIDLQPEINLYEDLRALDGGKEGLDVIKRIILHGQHLLKANGCIIMEIDPCHRYLLPMWMEKNKTTLRISQFYKDNNGIQRFVKLLKENTQ